MSLSDCVVRKAINRFHENGNLYVSRKKGKIRPHTQLAENQRELILSQRMLEEQRFLPLRERARLLQQDHGIRIPYRRLATLYKSNGISFRHVKQAKRLPQDEVPILEYKRVAFAKKLHRLKRRNVVCYMAVSYTHLTLPTKRIV